MTTLTKNQILTLRHLSDKKQHNDPPEGLSNAQFYSALKELKKKDMVYAAFVEGGVVLSSQIKTDGEAALDDIEEHKKCKQMEIDLTEEEFKVLKFIYEEGEVFQSPEWMDDDDFEEVCEMLIEAKLVRDSISMDHGLKISMKGKKLIEQQMAKKSIYKPIDLQEALKLENEYSREPLFRIMRNVMSNAIGGMKPAEIWKMAREICNELAYSDNPETLIITKYDYMCSLYECYNKKDTKPSLIAIELNNSICISRTILEQCYAMIYVSQRKEEYCGVLDVILNKIDGWKKLFLEVLASLEQEFAKTDFTDHDYLQRGSVNDTNSNVNDSRIEHLQKRIKELEQRNSELEDIISNKVDSTSFHDKVRLDILLKLINIAGGNHRQRGNGKKVAELMNRITGLPLQTCRNYCSDSRLNTSTHKDEVLMLNSLLLSLGIEIRL